MKEMPTPRHNHHRQTLWTRPIHYRGQRYRVVLLAMHDQGFLMQRLRHIRHRQPLGSSAYKNNFLDVTLIPEDLDGMARDKRPKRKPCNRQSTCGRCLLDNRQKISGLTGATIMRTRRCTHPTEIKTRHRPTALHKCTRQRLHNFVVHRSAKKWMRMRHHRHTKRSALGLV